ncbi:MAG: restriction endonuclease subunit S [Mesorhizobium sp.]|uniref:restriction endonuclease subunit S n=1 Tax=Mesorhizobium sp. TaxID=1871066 RepID=UPI000FE6AC17|nr:restriction endonuclease subunit S [Mesorhizobium sp.]RWQ45675.1 MAG: restriction endonuclease subunit S [Mesorhizobium sp.]
MLERTMSKAGWTRVAFGDVVRLSKARASDPEPAGYERVVGLEHIDPGDLRIRRWADIADGTTFTSVFKPGQVLFGKRRAYQRKVAVADFEGVCSGDIYVLEPANGRLMPELLPFLCQTDAFLDHAVGTSAGSLSPRTNWTSLASFEFLLPPVQEQARVVEVLRAVDTARAELEKIVESSEAMAVPLLRSLVGIYDSDVEGSLIKGQADKTPNNTPLLRVKDIGSKTRQSVQVGPFGGSVSRKYFAPSGVPVAKINNITPFGTLDLSELVYLETGHAQSLAKRYSIEPGDLLTAAQGATIGKSALADERLSGAIISQHLIRVSCDRERCLPDWIHSWFISPFVLRQIFGSIQGGTRGGLNTTDVESLLVPVPVLNEQIEHVGALRGLRSTAAMTRQRIKKLAELRSKLLMMETLL